MIFQWEESSVYDFSMRKMRFNIKNLFNKNVNYFYIAVFVFILAYMQFRIVYNIYIQFAVDYEDLFSLMSLRLKIIPLIVFQIGLLPVFYSLYYKSEINLSDLLYRLFKSFLFSIILVAIVQFIFIKYNLYDISLYIFEHSICQDLYVNNKPWEPSWIIVQAQAALGAKRPAAWIHLIEIQKKLLPQADPFKHFKVYVVDTALKIKSKL